MKFQLALVTISAAAVLAAPTSSITPRDLPGLDATQGRYAQAIIDRARADGVGKLGCATAIATALTESDLYMCANNAVPSSMGMPYDHVGSDQDSVGLFQQRAVFYTDIACTMDAGCSAGLFFNDMKAIGGWQGMGVAALSQAIQRSEIPEAYSKYVSDGNDVCNAAGGW